MMNIVLANTRTNEMMLKMRMTLRPINEANKEWRPVNSGVDSENVKRKKLTCTSVDYHPGRKDDSSGKDEEKYER
jgi:hypothetical protein